jgi:hypothetical protein
MDLGALSTAVLIVLFIAATIRVMGRKKRRVGSGASGTIYDLLNEDKRKAIEIIVEERAEARDPEDAEGNLPDLESPGRKNVSGE